MFPITTARRCLTYSVGALLAFSLVAIFLAPSASADSTYTYSGNVFDSFKGAFACPPECKITGSFTVDQPLPPNLVLATIVPTSFSFTDGEFTLTPGNTFQFVNCPHWEFSTNATGAITTWNVCIIGRASLGLPFLSTTNISPDFQEDTTNFVFRNSASVFGNPGTWSATIPEPSCLLLLLAGLVSIAGAKASDCKQEGAKDTLLQSLVNKLTRSTCQP